MYCNVVTTHLSQFSISFIREWQGNGSAWLLTVPLENQLEALDNNREDSYDLTEST